MFCNRNTQENRKIVRYASVEAGSAVGRRHSDQVSVALHNSSFPKSQMCTSLHYTQYFKCALIPVDSHVQYPRLAGCNNDLHIKFPQLKLHYTAKHSIGWLLAFNMYWCYLHSKKNRGLSIPQTDKIKTFIQSMCSNYIHVTTFITQKRTPEFLQQLQQSQRQ